MSAYQKIKDILLNAYLLPVRNNIRLALSVKNRIMPNSLHLSATTLAINRMAGKYLDGNIVFDIGCFNGSTATFFHHEFPGNRIIGFEASKQSYQLALDNTKGIDEIKIENYAVSDFCGITEFFVTDNKVSSSLNKLTGADSRFSTKDVEQINTITLDEYVRKQGLVNERILLLKLDVQGHEVKVLKGAKQVLSKTLFVLTEMSNHESYEGGSKYHEVDQLLRENGFKLHNLYAPYSYDPYLYEFDALYINNSFLKNS